jgi:hypothetical protein
MLVCGSYLQDYIRLLLSALSDSLDTKCGTLTCPSTRVDNSTLVSYGETEQKDLIKSVAINRARLFMDIFISLIFLSASSINDKMNDIIFSLLSTFRCLPVTRKEIEYFCNIL